MEIFRRAWRLQVGELELTDLDMEFKVQRRLGGTGTASITVYNPAPESRRAIAAMPRWRTFVELQAGYVQGMSTIFRGDLRRAIPARDGPTWSITITAGDGEHARRDARTTRSFAPGTTVERVLTAIAEDLGVGLGNARAAFRGARTEAGGIFEEGTVVRGAAAAELTRMCDSAHLEWSIQDGVLQVLPRGGSLAREALQLAPDSGLVGSPEITGRYSAKAKALLIPGLMPGQRVDILSEVTEGVYRIGEVEFTGSTAGGDWYADLTLRRPRPPLIPGGSSA